MVSVTARYAVILFLFWFQYGTVCNFAAVYLLPMGLSNTAVGLVSSLSAGLSILLQPSLAAWADRKDGPSVKTILAAFSLLTALCGALLLLTRQAGAAANFAVFTLSMLCVQAALPFSNALATQSARAGMPVHFSLARGFGSLGYAFMSFFLGRVIAARGTLAQPILLIFVSVLLTGAVLLYPLKKESGENGGGGILARPRRSDGAIAFFRRYPSFSVSLAGATLLYFSHVLLNNFVFQIVSFKGGGTEEMGALMALSSALELITMFSFPLLLRLRPCAFWFRLCGVFFTLKALFTLLAGNMAQLIPVQLLQPLAWGIITVSSVPYADERMQERDKIKGQAYMAMTLSAGNIFGSFAGGALLDSVGVPGMLLCAVFAAALGFAVILFSGRMEKPS